MKRDKIVAGVSTPDPAGALIIKVAVIPADNLL